MKSYLPENMNPIEDGIRQAESEAARLKNLIALAEEEESYSVKSRAAWRRQVELVHRIRDRLKQQRNHMAI